MERSGFLNINMLALTGIFDLSNIKHRELEGHMISKKVGIRHYV
jgi:hypothetical protein